MCSVRFSLPIFHSVSFLVELTEKKCVLFLLLFLFLCHTLNSLWLYSSLSLSLTLSAVVSISPLLLTLWRATTAYTNRTHTVQYHLHNHILTRMNNDEESDSNRISNTILQAKPMANGVLHNFTSGRVGSKRAYNKIVLANQSNRIYRRVFNICMNNRHLFERFNPYLSLVLTTMGELKRHQIIHKIRLIVNCVTVVKYIQINAGPNFTNWFHYVLNFI